MANKIDKGHIKLAAAPKAASVAAAGTIDSGYFKVSDYRGVFTVVGVGSGTGVPAVTYLQASASDGTGEKALSWSAGSLATDRIEVMNDPAQLDINNGFDYVKVVVTVTGGAGTVISLNNHGIEPRYAS